MLCFEQKFWYILMYQNFCSKSNNFPNFVFLPWNLTTIIAIICMVVKYGKTWIMYCPICCFKITPKLFRTGGILNLVIGKRFWAWKNQFWIGSKLHSSLVFSMQIINHMQQISCFYYWGVAFLLILTKLGLVICYPKSNTITKLGSSDKIGSV